MLRSHILNSRVWIQTQVVWFLNLVFQLPYVLPCSRFWIHTDCRVGTLGSSHRTGELICTQRYLAPSGGLWRQVCRRQWGRVERLVGGLLRSSGSCSIQVTWRRKLCSLRGNPEAGGEKGFELQRIKPSCPLKEWVWHLVGQTTAMLTHLTHLNCYLLPAMTGTWWKLTTLLHGVLTNKDALLLDHPERYQWSGLEHTL